MTGFVFKQFAIAHDLCAMKVGTDSIMLGSWVQPDDAGNILDIGTGSGLLAIMLAQKAQPHCRILGIDINQDAVTQARINGDNCPWTEQLQFQHLSLQQLPATPKFELIVSNPPYYPHGQQLEHKRQLARHTAELTHPVLLQHVSQLLTDNGCFACVLPVQFVDELVACAADNGLFLQRRLDIRSTPSKPVTRCLLAFGRQQALVHNQTLEIHNADGSYSDDYRKLAKDYYLKF